MTYDDDDYMSDADRAYEEAMNAIIGYCDLCEVEGHTFRTCPARDDDSLFEAD